MAFCSACGSQLTDSAKYCPNCGAVSQTGVPRVDDVAATSLGPQAAPQPVPPKSPNAGCGKAAAIGCGGILALIVIIAVIGAIVNQSTSNSSHEPGPRGASPGTHKATRSAAPRTLLDVEGSGIKTTQRFKAPDEWAIGWSYDCSNFGTNGNFAINVDGDVSDLAANVLGPRGHDVTYEHSGGDVYLQINSECDWHVKAVAP